MAWAEQRAGAGVSAAGMAAGAPWQASEEGVRRITQLLHDYLQPGADQARVFQELEQCKQYPDFNNYLAFVLGQGSSYSVQVRQSAGLLLKNNVSNWFGTAAVYRHYIRDSLLHCLRCNEKLLRQTAGTVISTVVRVSESVDDFAQLFPSFLALDPERDADALDGCLDAIFKISEEIPFAMDKKVAGLPDSPTNMVVPRLLQLLPNAAHRKRAMGSLNQMAYNMPHVLMEKEKEYVQGLFSYARDPDNGVRKLVSQGLVQLLDLNPGSLQPHMKSVIEYMLSASQDADHEVALEASEFWSAFCGNQLPVEYLREYVPQLVPVLLRNMVYQEDDEAVINAEMEEEGLLANKSAAEELKPFIPQSKNKGEPEEEYGEDDDFIAEWNLRKSSAQGLDILSTTFGNDLLEFLLPQVQQNLSSSDWRLQESAVLTIGAIAEGCYDGLVPHLNGLIPFLLPIMEKPRPLLRSITCWTISRYAEWVVNSSQQLLESVINSILQRILDKNKVVQEAACSALATFEERALELMIPHLGKVVQCLLIALNSYNKRSLRMLYDALGTLAECVGPAIGTPEYMNAILPPLFTKWMELGELDRELLPLLECVSCLVPRFSMHIAVHAEGMYTQCLKILSTHLQLQQANDPKYDRDFVIVALDLVGGLGEALGSSMEGLVKEGTLSEMLFLVCRDEDLDVRQSAFAVLGDLGKSSHLHLMPRMGPLLQQCLVNLDPALLQRRDTIPACNNACWALGELAVQLNTQMQQHVNVLEATGKVATLLNSKQVTGSKSLIENCAITLGRISISNAETIAPHCQSFMFAWCEALSCIRDDIEKEHAFMGLCNIIQKNNDACVGSPMVPLLRAIASWHVLPKPELADGMKWVLQMYQHKLGQQWVQGFNSIDPMLQTKLRTTYQLA